MDELEISGKRYISTRRAGKEHKYHSDYIGQLIRGGKVQGQKVGRSWYVDEASLAAYLGKEVPAEQPKELLKEAVKEPKTDEIVELEIGKPIRATPWRKIPEISRVESVGQTTPVVAAAEVGLEEVVPEAKEEVSRFAVEIEKDPISESDSEEEEGNHISIRNTLREEKRKNITYVANDAPVFPVKVRKQKISVPTAEVVDAAEGVENTEESSVVANAGKQSRNLLPLQYGAVAMLGVLAFILVGGMSYLLSYKTTVEGDQMSASITLTK